MRIKQINSTTAMEFGGVNLTAVTVRSLTENCVFRARQKIISHGFNGKVHGHYSSGGYEEWDGTNIYRIEMGAKNKLRHENMKS